MAASMDIVLGIVVVCLVTLALPTLCVAESEESVKDRCQGKENSYLWKVDTTPPVYLFGTMHVPYTKLWEYIPDNAKVAFSSSEDLCVELRLSDAATVDELTKCQKLPTGTAINDLLSSDIMDRIAGYLEKIRQLLPNWLDVSGISSLFGGGAAAYSDNLFNAMVGDWKSKRPIWILYMLSSLTEENIRLRKIPLLDLFMDNAAQGLGKTVQAVETAKDQCRPLNKITNEQVELALKVQLDYLEPMVQEASSGPAVSVEEDIETYRCGDFANLVSSTPFLPLPSLDNITDTSSWLSEGEMTMLKNTENYLWGQMVVRRNRKMAKAIDALLKKERNVTFFFALGAGHFLSDRNVIDRLRRKGHTVEHITFSQQVDGPSLPSNILELGHPGLIPHLMPIIPEVEDKADAADRLPTLSDDTLADIWQKYVVNAPSIVPPTISSYSTSPAPQSSQQKRDTMSGNLAPQDSALEIQDEMWLKEVSELLSYSNSEESTDARRLDYTNSAHFSSHMTSRQQLILTALLSLFVLFKLLH